MITEILVQQGLNIYCYAFDELKTEFRFNFRYFAIDLAFYGISGLLKHELIQYSLAIPSEFCYSFQ